MIKQGLEELCGIKVDMLRLTNTFGATGLFLLSGDANLQPSCKGKGPDRKTFRGNSWEAESASWGICMRNPTSFVEDAIVISLTQHKITVRARPCDAHHCCGAEKVSRAIDPIFSSCSLDTLVQVHNSIHCKAGDC